MYSYSAKHEMVELSNSTDPDETAHNELFHLDLHCLPFSLKILNIYSLDETFFLYSSYFCCLSGLIKNHLGDGLH